MEINLSRAHLALWCWERRHQALLLQPSCGLDCPAAGARALHSHGHEHGHGHGHGHRHGHGWLCLVTGQDSVLGIGPFPQVGRQRLHSLALRTVTVWGHRLLTCHSLLDVPPPPGLIAPQSLWHLSHYLGDMTAFLPGQEMSLPRRVLRARVGAELQDMEQDALLPHGQKDAGEGPGKHMDVCQSRN